MPKRAASRTPAGRPRCDRCNRQCHGRDFQEVNGRARHYGCWPAGNNVLRNWNHAFEKLRKEHGRDPDYCTVAAKELRVKYTEELQQLEYLEDFEKMMKAANCTCKAVCDVLKTLQSGGPLKSFNNPGLALAMVVREDFKSWPIMWQRMAFYAKVWTPKTEFTLNGPEVKEYKALIEKGIALEQARIEQGGLPKALTLSYLRQICTGAH